MKMLFCNESAVVFNSMLPHKLKSQNKLPNCCKFYDASELGRFIVHHINHNPLLELHIYLPVSLYSERENSISEYIFSASLADAPSPLQLLVCGWPGTTD